MRIWLLNPYGPLPGEGWRDYRFTLIARALAGRGHDVTWWTAAFAHHSKQQRIDAPRDTFRIELIPTPSFARNVGPVRLWFEYQFARRLKRAAKAATAPDVIIAADPPQFCGAAARTLAKRFGVPLIIDCLDLWPELFTRLAPAALGPMVRLASQPLFLMRRRTLRASRLTIAAADAYAGVLAREGAAHTATIPIGVDASLFSPRQRRSNDRLTVVYAGTLGEGYDLDTVVEAFRMLAKEMELIVAGRGPAEERLRAIAPANVRFAGVLDGNALRELYAGADVGLISYSSNTTVAAPVKMFDYIAAELPIVSAIDLPFDGVAVRYRAGDATSLRDVLNGLSSDRPRLQTMSESARKLRERIDAQSLYRRYAEEVEAVTGR